jgi:pimeloyl-ACP methyl ester carboxylesterase
MLTRSACPLFLTALLGAGCSAPQPATPPRTEPAQPPGLQNGSFQADLNGFSIHYEVHGQGPVLMTLPNSWGLTLGGLRALYRPYEDQLTFVYFDPRGMGGSGPIREESDMSMEAVRRDFDALRRHLGLVKVNAIGWSNGAINLVLLASEKPETLSSAIFLHGAASFRAEEMQGYATKYPDLFQKYGAFQKAVADASLSDQQRTALQREFWLTDYFPLMFTDHEAGKAKIQEMYQGVDLSWPHAFYSQKELPTFDFTDKLAAITVPSLVLAGAHDMISMDKSKELAEGLPNGKLVAFEQSGHFAPVEEPDKFRATLTELLSQK